MVRKARLVLCVALLFLLQATLVHRFSFGAWRPDLLLLGAACLTLEAPFKGALWSAFALGLLRDIGSSGRIGGSALLFVAACALVLFLREWLVRESFLTELALAAFFIVAVSAGDALLTGVAVPGAGLRLLARQAVGQALITTALTPLAYLGMHGFGIVDTSAET